MNQLMKREQAQATTTPLNSLAIQPPHRGRFSLLLAGFGTVAVCAGLFFYSNAATGQESDTTATYKEVQAAKADITSGIQESGSASLEAISITYDSLTSSSTSSDSNSTVKATVEELYVKAGQQVKEGDAIARMSTADIEDELSTMRQSYKEAQLSVEKAKIDQESGLINADATLKSRLNSASNADLTYDLALNQSDNSLLSQKTALNTAEAKLETLELKLDELEAQGSRYKSQIAALESEIAQAQEAGEDTDALTAKLNALAAEYYVYEEDYKAERLDIRTQIVNAQNTVEESKIKYEIAIGSQDLNTYNAEQDKTTALSYQENAQNLYDLEVAQLANTVASKELNLENLAAKIAKYESYITDGQVKATCDGLVMRVSVVEGDKISTNSTIATIANSANVYISVSIEQSDIGDISLGRQANVQLDAFPKQKFTGVVDSISITPAMSNSSTVSYSIKVKLDGDTSAIYEGMTGTITFIDQEVNDVLAVSSKAVFEQDGQSYVKTKNAAGEIAVVAVETGFTNGTMTEIKSGLAEGDTVLIESKVNRA